MFVRNYVAEPLYSVETNMNGMPLGQVTALDKHANIVLIDVNIFVIPAHLYEIFRSKEIAIREHMS